MSSTERLSVVDRVKVIPDKLSITRRIWGDIRGFRFRNLPENLLRRKSTVYRVPKKVKVEDRSEASPNIDSVTKRYPPQGF